MVYFRSCFNKKLKSRHNANEITKSIVLESNTNNRKNFRFKGKICQMLYKMTFSPLDLVTKACGKPQNTLKEFRSS